MHALLLAHPLLERDTDRIGNREHLVRAKTDRLVRRDAAQLPVHLANRNTRSQCQGDQTADCFRVRHRSATGLAEVDKDLEGLAAIILGDVKEHRAEWGLDAGGDAAESVRTRPLGATLQVFRLGVEQRLLQSRVLRLQLRDRPVELATLCPSVALGLRQLGRSR